MNVHDRLLADYFRWVDHVGLQQAIELPGERFTLASVHRANGKRKKKGWFTSNGAASAKNGGGGVATPRIERERERDLAEKKKGGKRVAATLERSDSAVSARLEETDGAMSDDALENANLSARLHRALLFLLIWGEAANVRHAPECICFLFYCAANAVLLPRPNAGQWKGGILLAFVPTEASMAGGASGARLPLGRNDFLTAIIRPLYHFLALHVRDLAGAGPLGMQVQVRQAAATTASSSAAATATSPPPPPPPRTPPPPPPPFRHAGADLRACDVRRL